MGRKGRNTMNNILKKLKKERAELEKILKSIDAFLENAPKGCLKWQNKKNKTYYYHQFGRREDKAREITKDNEKNDLQKWERKYIKKKDITLAQALAQKQYYDKVRPIIENNVNEINIFLESIQKKEVDYIYDSLSAERKNLVVPVQPTVKQKIEQWMEESYEQNQMYPEHLKYETEQGELVRSKSEVIIANFLYQHKEKFVYKYERPLELMEKGRLKTIYPDFTILNIYTGNIIYWEHAGRMDDPYYANEFLKKINMYTENDLFVGRDVIVTYETVATPLDIHVVKQLIKDMLDNCI